jgi:hypothetical protein
VGRNPEGLVDRDLIVARIDDATGHPLAVLVNFQCHGTVLAWENKMISPDWPGMLRKTIETACRVRRRCFFKAQRGTRVRWKDSRATFGCRIGWARFWDMRRRRSRYKPRQ